MLSHGLSLSPPAYQKFLKHHTIRLLFFLVSNSIFSPRQAGFRPGRSTLDQILYLSQSISNGFNKPRPGSRTILATIDFSKAFDSIWHPALFHKLISAGLLPCFARQNRSFISNWRACVVYQKHKSRIFRVRRSVSQESVLGPVLSSLFISNLPASLPFSVSCSLYADNLANTCIPCVELCFDWSAGLSTGVFLSIRANVWFPSFQWIHTKLTSSQPPHTELPPRFQFHSNLSCGHLRPHSFLF